MRVFVTGATGLVGCHVSARLVAEGHVVRAFVRDPTKLSRVLAPFETPTHRVESVVGDVLDAASVRDAVAGCDAAIHCAGFYSHEPRDAERLVRTNVEGTRIVLTGAARAGLDPVVHVSSMLALFPPPGPVMQADDPPTSPRAVYSRTKADAERIARALQSEGAPVVTVYPASVQGPHDPTVVTGVRTGPHILAEALRSGRVLVTQGGLGYTDVRDLARVLAATLRPRLGPRRYAFGGEFVSHADYHRLLCELTGRSLRAQRIPGRVLRLLGRIGDARQRWLGSWVELDSEAALVLTRSVPLDDADTRRELGIQPMPARDSFRDVLTWMAEAGVLEAEHVGRLASLATPGG